ncbi:hypothetical protein HNP40_002422 [Mycobacteroides chelonae]|nr:hypothetical protein [Mycobacteroides chelonae]
MTIKNAIAKGVLVGALSFGAFGLGTGVANAAPAPPQPVAVSTDKHDPDGDHRDGPGDWRRVGNWRGGDDHPQHDERGTAVEDLYLRLSRGEPPRKSDRRRT